MAFDHASRSLLTPRDLPRFPNETLFDRVARVLCAVECVPRKELYEAWEVARRVRRRLRGGRVVDLACGHTLLGHLMLLLDASSPEVIAVDTRIPASAPPIAEALVKAWPRLAGRVSIVEASLDSIEAKPNDVVVSVHACGSLTDRVLDRAIAGGAHVAVLPCCHDLDEGRAEGKDGGLGGWLDGALAIDVVRATRLRAHGYAVTTHTIPEEITPKNRLLIGIVGRHPSV